MFYAQLPQKLGTGHSDALRQNEPALAAHSSASDWLHAFAAMHTDGHAAPIGDGAPAMPSTSRSTCR